MTMINSFKKTFHYIFGLALRKYLFVFDDELEEVCALAEFHEQVETLG
jgi:hypothetical protein